MSLLTASRTMGHTARLPVPRRIGKYRVLLELGRGGMAVVYLALTQSAPGVSKLVVLKALLPEYAAEAEARAMFLDEARLAAQLNHGNVVQTYEVGQEADYEVIVMEYLEGQALASVLKRAQKLGRSLPLPLHLRVLMSVLEALHYTHELRGYDGAPLRPVHRDVSPQNVFITYDGRTKLLDFGIAKATSSTTHTTTGLIKGKIAYMSPEQMAGHSVDRRTDVYAVGCLLWAAAAGRKLWGTHTDVMIMHDVTTGGIPTPRSVNPDCDPELERIVMKALAKVDSRYSSALELHDELEHFCEARGFADRTRELSRFMTELFAEDRAELRNRIEHELNLVVTGVEAAHVALESLATAASAPNEQQLTSSTRTISVSTVNALPVRSASSAPKRRSWLAAAAVGALGVTSFALLRSAEDPPAPVSKAAISAPRPEPVPAPLPANVKVELSAQPKAAQLFLDDRLVQGNPAVLVVPKDGVVHRLRAELAGHRTASAEFAANGDQKLELKLEELPRESAPKKRSAPSPRSLAKTSSAPKADCTQPFYVAPDGIKKIKPACL